MDYRDHHGKRHRPLFASEELALAHAAAKRADRLPRKTDQESEPEAAAPAAVGYSKNTVRLIKAALSTVLSDAVDEGYIPTNPALEPAASGAGPRR